MAVRGYLTVLITQASSRTKANEVVWEDSFKEGFVKVEVRGGPQAIKIMSSLKPVSEGMLEWNETMNLEVPKESRELRIVLYQKQRTGYRNQISVVAALGISVEDILGAVPIDKWFEMFKPSAAGGGGFIRVHISFSEKSPAEARKASPPDELATPMGRYRSKFQQLLKATPVKAEARVALLEARVDSLQSKEQEPAAVQNKPQADSAKLLPWSPAMTALFIDPSKLTQGSLLGVSSSGCHTYSGTYKCTASSQAIQVALKALDLPSQAGMAAFEEQVQTLWRISTDSHHICRIYGVSCVDKQACLVMRLYHHSLAHEMMSASGDKRKLPIHLVIQRGIEICQGLQELHAAGIIMRSLSQANVLVTSSGSTAVLADFGLAQLDGASHNSKSEYKLPEMSHGQAAMTDKADMYALGCLLVEMCTEQPWDTGVLNRKDLEALQAEARQSVQQVALAHPSSPEGPAGDTLRIIPIRRADARRISELETFQPLY